jgi:tetraacyldisaccharide 4'-kinase
MAERAAHDPGDIRVHSAGARRVNFAHRIWAGQGAGTRLANAALAPAELLFRLASRVHHGLYDAGVRGAAHAAVPVISVGNLTIGGAGKTPFTGWLVERLAALGARPAVLHGGYAADEPALHRLERPAIPVYTGRARAAGAARAVADGADVIVLDDGFQHRRLARELDIVLIAAEHWTRKPRLLPRGGWREPPTALARAGLVVVTRKTADPATAERVAREAAHYGDAPVAIAHLAPAGWWRNGVRTDAPAGEAVLVSAVADWRPVAAHAAAAGARVSEVVTFPDHHAFDAADVERLGRLAGQRAIVTTGKDYVKLRAFRRTADVWVIGLELRLESGAAAVESALTRLLGGRRR